mmetsp:Transcript_44650/g.69858  ORF Transcript_44650/g.69858 Transcript_44650/m.69858 type:complete len:83 (+) Transcript_44650:160-408(+)
MISYFLHGLLGKEIENTLRDSCEYTGSWVHSGAHQRAYDYCKRSAFVASDATGVVKSILDYYDSHCMDGGKRPQCTEKLFPV